MADGLDALVGVLPVMLVGGLAMKMSDRLLGSRGAGTCDTPGRKIRSGGRGRGLAIGRGRGPIGRGGGLGFGSFSNLPSGRGSFSNLTRGRGY